MEFDIEKCVKLIIKKKEKGETTEEIKLQNQENTRILGEKEIYKFLKRTPSNK